MQALRGIVVLVSLLLGVVLLLSAGILYVEVTMRAESDTPPPPSALWEFVIDRGLLPLAPQTEDGSIPKPSAYARVVNRGLLGIGGAGIFFMIGAAVIQWLSRGKRNRLHGSGE